MRWIIALFPACLPAGASAAIVMNPSGAPRDALLALSNPPGQGPLDGLRTGTTMGPRSNPDEVRDLMPFGRGLYLSRECSDRRISPPDAGFAADFTVAAFCPTGKSTMVRRGRFRGGAVEGTVSGSSKRVSGTMTAELVLDGRRSLQPTELGL